MPPAPFHPMASPGMKTPADDAFWTKGELFSAASTLIPYLYKSPASSILLSFPPLNLSFFRRFCNFFLSLVFHFFLFLISRILPPPPLSSSRFAMADHSSACSSSSSSLCRALSHVLTIISLTPVSSRKYYLARSIADCLLDENLTFSPAGELRAVNHSVLSDAFAHTIRRLEEAIRKPDECPLDLVVGAISGGLRRIGMRTDEGGGVGNIATEKLGAELLWLAQKMTECGASSEAVVRWSAAEGLGRTALSAETRTQVAFVRVSVFLFRHANKMQAEYFQEGHDEDGELAISVSKCCMLMLRTWLPLLCRATAGIDAPILSRDERAEMVQVLEEIIQKLEWEQQEEALALWLYHFTSCPDSDWPNLESCYTRWYAHSRKLFLQ